MNGRTVFSSTDLTLMIAARLGIDPNDLGLYWMVDDSGVFQGVTLFGDYERPPEVE